MNNLFRDLRVLGISEGDVLLFHGSLKSLGDVEGGPEAVIDALVEAVGPGGTVAAPTTIPAFQGPRDIYDAAYSPSEAGLLTETLRLRPGARRSRSQTHSVAAIGARAEELAAVYGADPWRETPWGNAAFSEASPWGLLARWNAQYLLLGVDFDASPLLKYVQACYIGRHQPDYARQIAYPAFDFVKMGARFEARGLIRRGKVGQAEATLVRAGDLVQAALEILETEAETVAPGPDFVYWLRHVKGCSLTLRGGVAAADYNIPGWPATGHGTSLKTRILYIEDTETALAVVSLHLLALVAPDAWTVREAVGEALGLAPEQVFLCCTHLHSGPPTLIEGGLEDTILPHIIAACRSAAQEAKEKAGPIRLGVAQREVEDFHWESRIKLADGRSECIRRATPSTWRPTKPGEWEGGDYWLQPENELDKTLTVLRIENAAGEPIGGLYHFACHPLPDFMGYSVDLVERVMGEGFVCLVANGALATVDVAFERPRRGRVREGARPWLGEVFGYAVLETLARADVEDGGRIAVAREEIFLPMKPAFKAIQLGQYDGPPSSLARPQAIRGLQRNLELDGFPGEVQALTLGPLTLIGIPGELAGEIGRRITRGTHLSPTVIVGLANGEVAYLFPEESHRRGGYEVDPRCWSMTDGRAEMILRAAASKCLARLEQAALQRVVRPVWDGLDSA